MDLFPLILVFWKTMLVPVISKKHFALIIQVSKPMNKDTASLVARIYTGCPRRNGQNFGRVFLMLKYTDITKNTYVQI